MKARQAVMLRMVMSLPFVGHFFVSLASAAMPCRLTAADYKSLAASPSKLTPAKIDRLPAFRKRLVCQSRALYHRIVRQHGKVNHVEHFTADYLTAAEYRIVNKVVNAYLIRKLSGH